MATKKTRKAQLDMFADGDAVSDLPLFSGTPVTARASEFVPEARQQTQLSLLPNDMATQAALAAPLRKRSGSSE